VLAKKHLGQNFLRDGNIIRKIIAAAHPKTTDHFIEIGAGKGALTVELLPLVNRLDALELDRDLIPELTAKCSEFKNLRIHQTDALSFNLESIAEAEKLRVIGNLPYNISTPLIFHLLNQLVVIKDMHLMLQNEVAQRIASNPGSKVYGRISVMAQYFCEVELLFTVFPYSFYPAPKVVSAVLKLAPYQKMPFVAKNFDRFEKVVKLAFNQRRKTIANSLRELITSVHLQTLGIDPKLRAENLTVADFVNIANY
jgi:16S rRNA (adenine1518-N6/adenine1519-N6)-dimethyltransferase